MNNGELDHKMRQKYDEEGNSLKHVIDVLNEMWRTIPENKMPLYEEFNTFYRCFTQPLVDLEKRHDEVGFVNKGSGVVGVSVLSFMATLTDLLAGKRLSAQLDDSNVIIGWQWYETPGDGEVEEEEER